MQNVTPLRYPGGKAALSDLLSQVVTVNGLGGCQYIEPFAGGGGAALSLLFREHVDRIWLNDLDYAVFAFWESATKHTDELIALMRETPVTVEEWRRQQAIYRAPTRHDLLQIGFATMFLNRCNRSGIIAGAGPIGGYAQEGDWHIDVRFNKDELQRRLERIGEYCDRITVTNLDVIDCLGKISPGARVLVNLDPPYYRKGPSLYMNALEHSDHFALSMHLRDQATFPWVMTYDDSPAIRAMYGWAAIKRYSLRYSANEKLMGGELFICPPDLRLPDAQASKNVRWSHFKGRAARSEC